MEIIVESKENWEFHEGDTNNCQKIKIKCKKITGDVIIKEVVKKEKPESEN